MRGREFQTVGAAAYNKRPPKWKLVQGTYKLSEDDDSKMFECPCFERKTTQAMNTKLGTRTVAGPRHALTPRSKVRGEGHMIIRCAAGRYDCLGF